MFTRHCALDLCWSTIFSENRVPLFRIMLWDQARRRSPPRLRVFLLRLEDVAIEDRRDTQVRYVDQLRDVEIDGHAYHRIGLFAAQAFLLDQKVDHVERGVARGEAHVLGEVGERGDLLAAQIGRRTPAPPLPASAADRRPHRSSPAQGA